MILALIPARAGSKGIPGKNIIDLGGYPLIAYSIVAAVQSKLIDRVIVTTDGAEIAEVAREYGAEVPFLRPKEIANDSALDIEFFLHALDWLETTEHAVPDMIVHLRPTSPFRNPDIVDRAIEVFRHDGRATSLRSAHVMEEPGYKLFRVNDGYCAFFGAEDFPPGEEYYNRPRQMLQTTYIPNGYVDIVRPSVLRAGSVHGARIKPFVTERTADIDGYDSLQFAKRMLSRRGAFPALVT